MDAKAPDPKPGDVVEVGGRQAVFLYRTADAAVIRFSGEAVTRAVPLSRLTRKASVSRGDGRHGRGR